MYSLRLRCAPEEADFLSGELFEAGTIGIRELESGANLELLAGFADSSCRAELLERFAQYSPEWEHEDETDWMQHTRDAWPPRLMGERIFLAPVWCDEATPDGRVRIIHNPGLACGTGEHPCTQMAFEALERAVEPGMRVADIGSGSGILTIAALALGASFAVGVDHDEASMSAARENFELNGITPLLAVGSAESLADGCVDVCVANINATVLLEIWEDLRRVTKPGSQMILTGFTEWESERIEALAVVCERRQVNEWCCLTARA